MYLQYLNYFRGFAIFMIVMGHSFAVTNFLNGSMIDMEPFYRKFIFVAVNGGTSLFVFISGFLFHHIFYKRGFNFKKFMINKCKNVFMPYTVVVIPALIMILQHDSIKGFILQDEIVKIILTYLSGTALSSTWYIPFALCLFLASPLFIKFIEMKNFKKSIIIFGLLLSTIIQRPIHDLTLNVFQAFLYFSPVYCLGIYFSQNKEKLIDMIMKNFKLIFSMWIFMILIQVFLNQCENMHKPLLAFNGFDLIIIQKSVMCFVFLGIFYKLQNSKFLKIQKCFEILADYSFPIFFIHNYFVMFFFPEILKSLNISLRLGVIGSFAFGIVVCILSIVVAYIIKSIFKNKSRMVIGG